MKAHNYLLRHNTRKGLMDIDSIRSYYDDSYHLRQREGERIDFRRIRVFLAGLKMEGDRAYCDIGCGVGHAVAVALRSSIHCFGVDFSMSALRNAKETVNKTIWMLGEGEHLPLKSDTFEYVSALGSLEHFSSPEHGLREMSRISRQGARICLQVPNSFGILNRMGIYRGTEQSQEILLTLTEWIKLIRSEGYRVVSVTNDRGPKIFKDKKPFKIFQRILLKITWYCPSFLAYSFIFVCENQP